MLAIDAGNNMMISPTSLKYVLAFVLIVAITFVEDIEIFYNPVMVAVIGVMFVIASLSVCRQNYGIGLLIICIFVLVYVRFLHYSGDNKRTWTNKKPQ